MAGFMEHLWEKVFLFTEVAKGEKLISAEMCGKTGRAGVELGVNGLEVLLQQADSKEDVSA